MSNHPRRIKLADYLERKMSAEGIPIELPDGSEIVIPPAELWPDAAYQFLDANDVGAAVVAIIGQEASDRFTAAGGNWRVLNGIVRETQGLDVGESEASPTS